MPHALDLGMGLTSLPVLGSGIDYDRFINGDLQRFYFDFDGIASFAVTGGNISLAPATTAFSIDISLRLDDDIATNFEELLLNNANNSLSIGIVGRAAGDNIFIKVGGGTKTDFTGAVVTLGTPYKLTLGSATNGDVTITLTALDFSEAVQTETLNIGGSAPSNNAWYFGSLGGGTLRFFSGPLWDIAYRSAGVPVHTWAIDDEVNTLTDSVGTNDATLTPAAGTWIQDVLVGDGLTADTAWSTLEGVQDLFDADETALDSLTVGVKRGTVVNDSLALIGTQNFHLRDYGSGAAPIIQRMEKVLPSAFTDLGSNHFLIDSVNGTAANGMSLVVDGVWFYRQPTYAAAKDLGNENNKYIFFAAETGSASATGVTLTVAGTPWEIDQWVGVEVTNTTTGATATITSNTTNVATGVLSSGQWTSGNAYSFPSIQHVFSTTDLTAATTVETSDSSGDLDTLNFQSKTDGTRVTTNLRLSNLDIRHGKNNLIMVGWDGLTLTNVNAKWSFSPATSTAIGLWLNGERPVSGDLSTGLVMNGGNAVDTATHNGALKGINGATFTSVDFLHAGFNTFEMLGATSGLVFDSCKMHAPSRSTSASIFRFKGPGVDHGPVKLINCELWGPYTDLQQQKNGGTSDGAQGSTSFFVEADDNNVAIKAVNCTFYCESNQVVRDFKNAPLQAIDIRLVNCLLLHEDRTATDFVGGGGGIILTKNTDYYMESSDVVFNDWGADVITDNNLYFFYTSPGTREFNIDLIASTFATWKASYSGTYSLDGNSVLGTVDPVNERDRDKAGILDLTPVVGSQAEGVGSQLDAAGAIDPDVPTQDINGVTRDMSDITAGCHQ